MTKRWEIAIVGGTGGMGQIFAKELKPFADVIIISRSLEKAQLFSKKLGVRGGLLKDCKTADIIIISVPIENTIETCQNLFPLAKSGSLLMDLSAVKDFLKTLKPKIPPHLSYISLHPLFGPAGTFQDYNVVILPIKADNWLPHIQDLLKNLGAQTIISTIEEHDFIMSKTQVAHHFIYLMLAAFFSETEITPEFFTRSFRKTLENFSGIEKNLPAILEIQRHNPHANVTRQEFANLIQAFIELDDDTKITELLSKIKAFKKTYLGENENSG